MTITSRCDDSKYALTTSTTFASCSASAADVPVSSADAVEVELVVLARYRCRLADVDDAAAFEQHRAVAEALDRAHVVGHEQDRPTLLPKPAELVEALLLEGGVADGEHLVDQQDVGVDLDRDGERQPHEHPRGVVLQLELDEFLELGEGDDVVEAVARLLA